MLLVSNIRKIVSMFLVPTVRVGYLLHTYIYYSSPRPISRGGLPNSNQQTRKFIHKLSMLREFCGGKRAGGDERARGCPVPALGPSCLIEGYLRYLVMNC